MDPKEIEKVSKSTAILVGGLVSIITGMISFVAGCATGITHVVNKYDLDKTDIDK